MALRRQRTRADFQFYDWKTSVTNVLKLPGSWHFKFNASKRFFLRKDKNNKIGIKGEPNYVSEAVNYGNVCKRGKSYENIKPTLMNIGVPVKTEKLNDVRKLLIKHFGEDWITIENLQHYKFIQEEENKSNLIETYSEETLMEDEIDITV
ncbi:unnamed protein product [Parnassius apollo]|uniref:(apollo) hypothetical protein n=1 Tax=Parnassius apollo TaxID=110799 RepID=A0A8S3WNX9_PARAO|nr:unnamed protein product [Parnassius apollo]